MIDLIKKELSNNKDVSAWTLLEVCTHSTQLFYVSMNLETNRAVDTKEYILTIYKDNEDKTKRGNSSVKIELYYNKKDIANRIKEAVKNATLAQGKYFDLPYPTSKEIKKIETNLADKPFMEYCDSMVNATFRANAYKDGSLNATEFFLYQINKRLLNSNGIDISWITYKGNIETIPTFKSNEGEFETYLMVNFASLDTKKITQQVDEALQNTKLRSQAVSLPKGTRVKILLHPEESYELFYYFIDDLNYNAKFNGYSKSIIGQSVQGDNSGDSLNIKLTPYLKSNGDSSPVDLDGVTLEDVVLIKNGIAKNYYGNNKLGYYLGIKNPTGNMNNIVIGSGTRTIEEIKKEPYIECLKFSGFQMDNDSGFCGGEVRLGLYFDGEKIIPVSGFSISGDMNVMKSN